MSYIGSIYVVLFASSGRNAFRMKFILALQVFPVKWKDYTRLRWQFFCHVLRLEKTTPAQQAMDFYCSSTCAKAGRAQTTLPVVLFNEFHECKQLKKKTSYKQKPDVALRELRKRASDREGWRMLVEVMVLLEKGCSLEAKKLLGFWGNINKVRVMRVQAYSSVFQTQLLRGCSRTDIQMMMMSTHIVQFSIHIVQ